MNKPGISLQLCFSFLLLFVFKMSIGQGAIVTATDDSIAELNALRAAWSKNKKIPVVYEAPILKALSYFPELKDYRVDFVIRKGYAPLSARPTFGGIFRSARKRKYKVFISSKVKGEWDRYTLKNMPYAPSVGIVGHEIGHVKTFSKMSGFSLIGLGFSHISKNYMNRFEYRNDSLCIAQGLGEWLLAAAVHARVVFEMPDPQQLNVKGEKANYRERYMSPATIRLYMEDYPELYQPKASSR